MLKWWLYETFQRRETTFKIFVTIIISFQYISDIISCRCLLWKNQQIYSFFICFFKTFNWTLAVSSASLFSAPVWFIVPRTSFLLLVLFFHPTMCGTDQTSVVSWRQNSAQPISGAQNDCFKDLLHLSLYMHMAGPGDIHVFCSLLYELWLWATLVLLSFSRIFASFCTLL